MHHLQGEEWDELPLLLLSSVSRVPPLEVMLELDKKPLTMDVDTEASLSLVLEETFRRLWPKCHQLPPNVKLHSYTGDPVGILGRVIVVVVYKTQRSELPLLVVKNTGPSLFG